MKKMTWLGVLAAVAAVAAAPLACGGAIGGGAGGGGADTGAGDTTKTTEASSDASSGASPDAYPDAASPETSGGGGCTVIDTDGGRSNFSEWVGFPAGNACDPCLNAHCCGLYAQCFTDDAGQRCTGDVMDNGCSPCTDSLTFFAVSCVLSPPCGCGVNTSLSPDADVGFHECKTLTACIQANCASECPVPY
jgi:hypothetical protein